MAGTIAKQETPLATPAAKSPTGPAGPRKLLIFAAVLLTFAIVQIAITELLLPPGHSKSEAAREQEKKAVPPSDTGHSKHETTDQDLSEVALGSFSFSNRRAVAGVVLHVDFNLAAVVSQDQATTLESQVRNHRGRIREAVNTIVRNSSYEELNDPNLASLKRLLREDINRVLDLSLIVEVVINEIRVLEQ